MPDVHEAEDEPVEDELAEDEGVEIAPEEGGSEDDKDGWVKA
ncbi:hypothetical protein ABT158_07065 [Nonomuraea sp. NPDC001636]